MVYCDRLLEIKALMNLNEKNSGFFSFEKQNLKFPQFYLCIIDIVPAIISNPYLFLHYLIGNHCAAHPLLLFVLQ